MSETSYLFLFSLTIVFAAVIGAFRYRNMDPAYKPFVWYIFISLANELLVGFFLVRAPQHYQVADWNLFNLFECVVFLIQFLLWHRFVRFSRYFYSILGALVTIWIAENFVFSNLFAFNYKFVIAYSFVLALFSIYTLNNIVIILNSPLFKNPLFIICVSMLIYFVYTIIVFTFLLISKDKALLREVFAIKVYVNALVNLLYAVAAFYLPGIIRRKDYFDQLSDATRQV